MSSPMLIAPSSRLGIECFMRRTWISEDRTIVTGPGLPRADAPVARIATGRRRLSRPCTGVILESSSSMHRSRRAAVRVVARVRRRYS